jgi:predicted DNA-binding protein (UPF0251 family)
MEGLMELYQRIIDIIGHVEKNQITFAEKIGVNHRTFQGYLTQARQDNLWPLLPQILKKYPDILRDWLYFGEGEKLKKPRTFRNVEDKLVGDLLHDIIKAELRLSFEDFAKSIGMSKEAFQELLDSRRAPTWNEMVAMHTIHGISIHFLMTFEGDDIISRDSATRALRAVKTIPNAMPMRGEINAMNLIFLFNASAKEARDFSDKYNEYSKKYLEYVVKNNGSTEGAPAPPELPDKLVMHLAEKYGINPDWLLYGYGHSHTPRNDKQKITKTTTQGQRHFIKTTHAPTTRIAAPSPQKGTED